MTEQERIEKIITMLDAFVSDGGGHMNVTVEDTEGEEQIVNTFSVDCTTIPTACSVPTLHQGIDDES